MVNGGGLNRRETTWDLESYRRHTLYDSPFDSMNALSLSLSCAKNMVHARPVEFLNEGDVCEERVCGCVAHLGGEGGRGKGPVYECTHTCTYVAMWYAAGVPSSTIGTSLLRHIPWPGYLGTRCFVTSLLLVLVTIRSGGISRPRGQT